MALKPVAWMKIYTPTGAYVASCNDPAAAAALMAFYGDGAEIRNGHTKKNTIWREGHEAQCAGESYDYVIQMIHNRTTATESDITLNKIVACRQGLNKLRRLCEPVRADSLKQAARESRKHKAAASPVPAIVPTGLLTGLLRRI